MVRPPKSVSRVAVRLNISFNTFDEHPGSAQRKLRCTNRTQTVARTLVLGYLES